MKGKAQQFEPCPFCKKHKCNPRLCLEAKRAVEEMKNRQANLTEALKVSATPGKRIACLCINSGCTQSMVPEATFFDPSTLQSDDTDVTLAADSIIRASARGDIILTDVDGSDGPINLENVLLVPELRTGLQS